MTFWATATTYFPATALGLLLLAHTPIRWVPVRLPMDLPSPWSPVRALAAAVEQALQGGLGRLAGRPVPEEVVGGSLFLLGFFLIGLALQVLDRAIPCPFCDPLATIPRTIRHGRCSVSAWLSPPSPCPCPSPSGC